LLVRAGIIFLDVDCNRTVATLLQTISRTADAVALEVILDEELVLVEHVEVPEHRHRRDFVLIELKDVFVRAGERSALIVYAGVWIENFLWHVCPRQVRRHGCTQGVVETGSTPSP
jgi:hypothetical protein